MSELRDSGERGVLFTVVEGEGVGGKELVLETGERLGGGVPDEATGQFDELVRRGRNKLLSLDDDAKVFAEWYGPPPRRLRLRRGRYGRGALQGGEAARLDGHRR